MDRPRCWPHRPPPLDRAGAVADRLRRRNLLVDRSFLDPPSPHILRVWSLKHRACRAGASISPRGISTPDDEIAPRVYDSLRRPRSAMRCAAAPARTTTLGLLVVPRSRGGSSRGRLP